MQEKILIINDKDEESYIDFWFDESLVKGYYITDENHLDKSVNIITGDSSVTLKQSDKLIKYLLDKKW